ncbi:MAG: lysine-sensitive aspartokinase 3 [bacterium]
MIVMKFGGSSVESAAAIERVASIVRARVERRPVVVVSAMGKTTNRLLAIANAAVSGERAKALELLKSLRTYHEEHGRALVRPDDLPELEAIFDEHFSELAELVRGLSVLGELTPRSIDTISSYGERLSSRVVTLAFRRFGMDSVLLDSRDVIVTDRRHTQAAPLYSQTYERLAAAIPPLTDAGKVVVMGGFIGATEDGVTTTLGRGGSDFSAAIVGAGIGAEEIQIWTDVDGVLTADPSIIPGARRLKIMSFAEAAELAYFGAKVLHPSTVIPAIEKNIPVLVLNSRHPDFPGTRIVADAVPSANPVKSIAYKEKITVVNITSTRMLMAHGFLRRIFEVFDKYRTAVDMISTSEVSVSLTIDDTSRLDDICRELREIADVQAGDESAILCLVGDNIRGQCGIAARVFGALRDVNIRMISEGASQLNLSLVVARDDLNRAVRALHEEFFQELDPELFYE